MRIKLLLLAGLLAFNAQATENRHKVAVIDTGLDLSDPRFSQVLCESGHKDFTGTGLKDNYGHGTHVAGLIKQNARNSNYCLLILKFWNKKDDDSPTQYNMIKAMEYAVEQHVDIVNISGGGEDYNSQEQALIHFNSDITFIVAAGNEHHDLNKIPYYPACYGESNEIVVGNSLSPTSNYGIEMKWETGDDVVSTWPNGRYKTLSGTSMSTAIHTGNYIYGHY